MIGSEAKSNHYSGVFGFSFKTIASSPKKLVLLNPLSSSELTTAYVYETSAEGGKNIVLARQFNVYGTDISTPEKTARLGKVLLDFQGNPSSAPISRVN